MYLKIKYNKIQLSIPHGRFVFMHYQVFIFKKKLEKDERIVLQVSDMTRGPLVIFKSYLNLLEKQNENTCCIYLTPFDSPSLKLHSWLCCDV